MEEATAQDDVTRSGIHGHQTTISRTYQIWLLLQLIAGLSPFFLLDVVLFVPDLFLFCCAFACIFCSCVYFFFIVMFFAISHSRVFVYLCRHGCEK